MKRQFVLLIAMMALVAGCGTTGGHRAGHKTARETPAKLYVIQEDMPAESQSIASGRDLLNKLVHLGKKEENIEPTPVAISSLAEETEKTIVSKIGKKAKTFSFKGKSKPSDVRAWVKDQGANEGEIVDAQVLSWGVKPYAKDKYRYQVFLKTRTSLTDVKTGKVVGSYECSSDSSATPAESAPTKYELLKDDKALIKRMYRERAGDCAQRAAKNLL